jgi:hypothetical protein
VSRDFLLQVFFIFSSPQPKNVHLGQFPIFSKLREDNYKSRFTNGINDNGCKFVTGINDTGGKFATGTAGVVDTGIVPLKVHKRENFLGSNIEICTFS